MNISIISGSARANNNTIRVAKAIKALHPNDQVSLVDFQGYDIPLINQGTIDVQHLSPFQAELMTSMRNAHIIYLITPEYNWSTTPEILNWLHRFGERTHSDLFNEKVFALVGVSTGKGGKAPLLHLTNILNKVVSFLDLNSFVSPRIFESHFTKEVLTEEGVSTGNTEYDKGLNLFVAYTKRMAARWHQH